MIPRIVTTRFQFPSDPAMEAFERLAEQRILEAMEQGEFDNLPWRWAARAPRPFTSAGDTRNVLSNGWPRGGEGD